MNNRTTPVVVGASRSQRFQTILIAKGNTVLSANSYYGTIYGCKIPSTGVTAVPTATPSPSGSYSDGLCCGVMISFGAADTYVWVSTKVNINSTNISDQLSTLIENMMIQSRYSVLLPITGGGGTTARVYLPWFVG
jgi:hypothetical protein